MLTEEVCLFRQEMTATRTQMRQLNKTMQSLTSRLGACHSHIDGLDKNVAILDTRGKGEEGDDTGSLQSTINLLVLRAELNDRDKDLLCNDVDIAFCPRGKGESVEQIVMTLGSNLGGRTGDGE